RFRGRAFSWSEACAEHANARSRLLLALPAPVPVLGHGLDELRSDAVGVSPLSHHDSRRGLLLARLRLALVDPRRLEQCRTLTGGPDSLAMLVGLSHEFHRARLGHQGGRALL